MKKLLVPLVMLALAACTREPRDYEAPPEPMQPYPQQPANMHPYQGPRAAPTERVQVGPYQPPPVASAGPLKTAQVSAYMDNQENDLRAHMRPFGVLVARRGDGMVLTIPNSRLFGDGASVSSDGASVLQALAASARHYDHTAITVNSYTDTTGTADKNVDVSLRRAKSVTTALSSYGVAGPRLSAQGMGEQDLRIKTGENVSEPRNRRTEIRITPAPMG
jgi:outer membrane protein OmpA-like peptidoglycan-associated protein